MSGNPFEGATRDPIALLEQLIGQVGGLKSQMEDVRQELKQELKQEISGLRQELKQELKQEIGGLRQELKQELKQEIGGLRQELKQEIGLVRADIAKVGSDMFRFASAMDKRHDGLKSSVEAALDNKDWLARYEQQDKYAEFERRLADLEETERRRKEGKGA